MPFTGQSDQPRGRGRGSYRGGRGRGGQVIYRKLSEGYTANNRLITKPKDPIVESKLDEKGDLSMDVDMVDVNENILTPPRSGSKKINFRNDLSDEACICLRPLKRVTCCICGFYTEGRLRRVCVLHPRDIYLLDVTACPECGVPTRLMQELNFPASYESKATNSKISN